MWSLSSYTRAKLPQSLIRCLTQNNQRRKKERKKGRKSPEYVHWPSVGEMWNLLGSATCLLTASTRLLGGDLTGSEARPRCKQNSSPLRSETPRKKTSNRRMRAMTCHSAVPAAEPGSGMLAVPTAPPPSCQYLVSCSCAFVYFLLSNSFQFFLANSWHLTKYLFSDHFPFPSLVP